MGNFASLKQEVGEINRSVMELISGGDSEPIVGAFSDGWRKTCASIEKQISEDTFRIAVVGAVKSGKSTFVNSLFHGDYLKRGAGVITSIVTKVRKSETLKADLAFKSVEDVNREMANALALLPGLGRPGSGEFDIRNDAERKALRSAAEKADRETLLAGNGRDVNVSLMASYLKGYDKTGEILASGSPVRIYHADDFEKHRDFVSDDSLAVYLKDVNLQINSGRLDGNLEIADCQGSDSPNPLHMVMVQDYLYSAHQIFYVISGRTGVREADIRFLSVIRKMGMADNILFVVNFDIDEHESETGLMRLIEKIREELGLVRPDPELFALSALYNLFKSEKDGLSERDAARLGQWEKDLGLTRLSDSETERLYSGFLDKPARAHGFQVIRSLIGRIDTICAGLNRRIAISREVFETGRAAPDDIMGRIADHRKKMNQFESLVKTTLNGAVADMKRDLANDIDHVFDPKTGNIVKKTVSFVRDYHISSDKMNEYLKRERFSDCMDAAFREFRHSLDKYMAENIMPEMMRFAKEEEKKIRDGFDAIAGTFESALHDAALEHDKIFEEIGISRVGGNAGNPRRPSGETARRSYAPASARISSETALPPVGELMRYGAKVKTEAFMILGISRIAKLLKRLLKKPDRDKKGEIAAIKKGAARMKRDTEQALLFHFKDYRENMKYQHIFKFAEKMAENFHAVLMEQYMAFHADLSYLSEYAETNHSKSGNGIANRMEKTVSEISEHIGAAREKLESALAGEPFESTE